MRPSRLVLLRWHEDVIAAQTLREGESPDLSALSPEAPVSIEVIDLSSSHASFRGPIHVRPLLLAGVSLVVHAVVAALLVTSSRRATQEDLDRDRFVTLRTYSAKLAVSDAKTNETNIADEPPAVVASAETVSVAREEAQPSRSLAPHVTRQAPMRGGDASQTTGEAVCSPPHAMTSSGPMCTREVVVRSLTRSSPVCFTDDAVSVGEHGTVTFPCDGDGPAKLTFDHATFEGAEASGTLHVCTGTQFPWSDGCTWTSAQKVTGSIASGALHFSYAEAPKRGQGSCASSCSAMGDVDVR